MKHGRVIRDGQVILSELDVAESELERMRGLLGRRDYPPGRGFLINHCGSVHTFFMQFALDLVFLDRDGRVVRVRAGVPPGRIAWGGGRACRVIEMRSGSGGVALPVPGERWEIRVDD